MPNYRVTTYQYDPKTDMLLFFIFGSPSAKFAGNKAGLAEAEAHFETCAKDIKPLTVVKLERSTKKTTETLKRAAGEGVPTK